MEARNSLSPAAHEIETPDGRIFLVHAAPILDSANKLSGAVETVLDITDIKRTENELRKSQEQLNLAMEGARLFSWDWHIPTGVFYSDRQWENRFGYSREELPKTIDQVFSLVHPEDLPSLKHAIQKHFEEKSRVFSFEFRIRSKSDNYIWVMSLGAVLALNDDGRPLRMVGVSRDITEQKQAREEIDQQRNALYHMNRTATMGELTASLAHELNQPLAAIMTNAQAAKRLLEKEPADLAEAAEALDDIIQDDHRAGETILRIRRMLQKGEIEMAPVEINHLIREVAEFLNSEIIARNVLIHLDLSPNSRLVMGDRIQLQQVLLNLMLNACEAMASSEIEHKVLIIRSDTRSADRVSVSVRDTGCGIAPERLQEIFKLFHSSKAMGMGAGLAICRSIITAHGGEIWAENNQDRGATFTFKLPTISQQDPAQGPPS
jgi:PAS domain S-box-containing protein